MKALAMILAAMFLVACSGPGVDATLEQAPSARPESGKADRPPRKYVVRIHVGKHKELQQHCQKQPPLPAPPAPWARFTRLDVLVSREVLDSPEAPGKRRLPFSCVEGEFFEHRQANPLHEETTIQLSRVLQDSILWRSNVPFRILRIETRTEPPGPYPFAPERVKLMAEPSQEHDTGPIVNAGADYRRYKVVFEINGVIVDPDVDCVP